MTVFSYHELIIRIFRARNPLYIYGYILTRGREKEENKRRRKKINTFGVNSRRMFLSPLMSLMHHRVRPPEFFWIRVNFFASSARWKRRFQDWNFASATARELLRGVFTFHGEYRRANNERVSCAERSRRTHTNSTKTSTDPPVENFYLSARYSLTDSCSASGSRRVCNECWTIHRYLFFFFLISRRRKNEKERIFSIFEVILSLGENLIFFYPHCIINLIYMINL